MTVDLLREPNPEMAARSIQSALGLERFILIAGRCSVLYKGRASSSLEPGERVLIIKKDGSLLIHRSSGWKPVNWQPPGCRFEISADEDHLRIRAIRQNPPETIIATFDQLSLVVAMALKDSGEFSLDATEEDMQRTILTKPEIIEPGFRVIEYEKRVEPGFVDVYGTDRDGKLVVIEIKRKAAGKDAVFQLAKYVKAISEASTKPIRPILAAPSLMKGTQRLLHTTGIEFHRLDPKQCAKVLKEVDKEEVGRLSRWI